MSPGWRAGGGRALRATVLAAALVAGAWPAAAGAAPADSLAEAAGTGARFDFDAVPRDAFLRRHAFSLDHFLEFAPGGLVVRLGPIGNDAFYSRWGIGRGRSQLVVNGIPMNDPQNDTAPWIHTATSGVAGPRLDAAAGARAAAPWIEGTVVLDDLAPPSSRPHTFVELSKGDNDLRQRRVRFASQAGRVGVDLAYDEVLDDGYDFDADGTVGLNVPDYGKSRTRNAGIVLRGGAADGARYAFGLRRYRSATEGDLVDATSEADRSGHLAWMDVGVARAAIKLYGRGYRSDYPDSSATNETAGAVLAWDAVRAGAWTLDLSARSERTRAVQEVGGASARNDATRGAVGAATRAGQGSATRWFADGTLAMDDNSSTWGAGTGLERDVPRGVLRAQARRSFRLPSLGEYYLPVHERDGRTLSGSVSLDAETAFEAGADWVLAAGPWTNQVRAVWMRASDTIAYRPVADDSLVRSAQNGAEDASMAFLEERLRLDAALGPIRVRGDAAGLFSDGDRVEAFASVPRVQVNASLFLGGEMFEKTSALYAGVEYAFADERIDFEGRSLPAFHVVNFAIEGRLIDARLYLRMLNAFDEVYQTQGGYLMTPRTFVYGIEWTLFD